MKNILKNTLTIFKKDKDFLKSIILEPVFMLLIFSFFLAFQTSVRVSVINHDTGEAGTKIIEMLDDIKYIKVVETDENKISDDIASDSIKFAVVIGEDVSSQISSGETVDIKIVCDENSGNIADYIKSLINLCVSRISGNESDTEFIVNDTDSRGIPINNSLGVLIFKMISTGSILATLLINDRKKGIADRIKLSGVGTCSYLSGVGIVFLICSFISSVMYYLCALIFHFNFGMEHKWHFLIIMLTVNLLAVCFNLLLSALVNNDGILWNLFVMIILPTSVFSGAFFDYNAMPKAMQVIGACFPQRWVVKAIEILQSGGSLVDTIGCLLGVVAVSVVFFIIAAIMTQRRLSGKMKAG
jgi:ABC-2 type transport system permease protein